MDGAVADARVRAWVARWDYAPRWALVFSILVLGRFDNVAFVYFQF